MPRSTRHRLWYSWTPTCLDCNLAQDALAPMWEKACNAAMPRPIGTVMMGARALPFSLFLLLGGCFSPSVPSGESESAGAGAAGGSSGGSPGGTGSSRGSGGVDDSGSSGSAGGPGGSSGVLGEPPVITLFTANGADSGLFVSFASGVDLRVEATDPDGTVVSAEFFRDGESIGIADAKTGGGFDVEHLVSGAEGNGDSVFEVTVTDNEGNTADAEIDALFDLPNGGLIEGWNFDNGESASAYAVRPTSEGDHFVWAGVVEIDGESVLRVDREEGTSWQSTLNDTGSFGADIVIREDGTHLVAGSFRDGETPTTGLYSFSAAGNPAGQTSVNGAPTPGLDNWAQALEVDAEGRPYVLGFYSGGATAASYLLRLSDDLSVDWKRDVTDSPMTDGEPFAYDFDVREDGAIVVVGSRPVGTNKLWLATYDASGDLQEQQTINSEFETSLGYDVSWFGSGGLVVAGTINEGDGWSRFVRAYDDGLLEEWTVGGPSNGDFAQAITTDGFGRAVVASTENCSLNSGAGLFESCRLVIRSYSRGGVLRWQHNAEGDEQEFNGPVLWLPGFKADIEVDRYGYVYVSAQHRLPLGGDERRSEWWAEKHHP